MLNCIPESLNESSMHKYPYSVKGIANKAVVLVIVQAVHLPSYSMFQTLVVFLSYVKPVLVSSVRHCM